MNDLAIDLFGEPIPVASLAELAAAINAAVAKADAALDLFKRQRRATLDDYAIAGQLLLTAKAQVEHGQWLPWLGEHCPDLAEHRGRRAQEIMQIARNLETFKSADSATLTKSDALKLLNAPEPDSDPITGDLLPVDGPATPDPADVIEAQQRHIEALERRIDMVAAATLPAPVVSAEAKQQAVPDTVPAPKPDSGGNDDWYTPPEYIEAARLVMGGIDLDPASCEAAQATVKADRFFTKEQDGLAQPWHGRIWLNPPYSRELIGPFIAKLIADYQAGAVRQAVVLTNNDTETGWFHELAKAARVICFTKGRVHFTSPHTKADNPRQGQAFTYLGDRPDAFAARFKEFGQIAELAALRQEHQERQAQTLEQANYEANRAAFHNALNQLFYGAGIVHNPANCVDPDEWIGTWSAFERRYCHSFQEFRDRLIALQQRIPFVLELLDGMRKAAP
jgi:ParB family chromosome partitioning protein